MSMEENENPFITYLDKKRIIKSGKNKERSWAMSVKTSERLRMILFLLLFCSCIFSIYFLDNKFKRLDVIRETKELVLKYEK